VTPATVSSLGLAVLLPPTFASNIFVQPRTMPGWLQAFAKHQPVTQVVNGARSLMVGGVLHDSASVVQALLWCAGMLVILAPFAVRKYRKVA